MTTHDLYLDRLQERRNLRGQIRAAGDVGDFDEVERLIKRAHDIELEVFAYAYTEIRYARAQGGKQGGYNPQLEEAERKLSEILARAGEPSSGY